MAPSKPHFTMLSFARGLSAGGTSAKTPPLSASMMENTMRQGPSARADSVLGASALTLRPRLDAAQPCSASVASRWPRLRGFKPAKWAVTVPKSSGNSASRGASTHSLARKYGTTP